MKKNMKNTSKRTYSVRERIEYYEEQVLIHQEKLAKAKLRLFQLKREAR